jgi:hypothetical protein
MNRLAWCAVAALAAGAQAAAPLTASKAVAEIPPLAKTATPDLECPAEERVRARAEELAGQGQAASANAPQTMTEAEGQALQAMNEPEFYGCLQDLQQRPPELWLLPLRDKLDAKLVEVAAARSAADAAYCAKRPADGCTTDPAGVKKFNAQAAQAGTQFLKEAQPVYAAYLKEISQCIAQREKVIAAAGASGTSGFEPRLAVAIEQNWALAGVAASAHSGVCSAARDAARKFLEMP